MNDSTTPCRDCQNPVSLDALTCPQCGVPRPALAEWNGEGFEWKSAATWMGLPLVHIAFGTDKAGQQRVARGIVAVGLRARGVVACGIIAMGGLTFGVVSLGFVSFGVVAVAVFAALGVNAIAPLAFGVTALGYWCGGLETMGWHKLFGLPHR